MSAAGEIWRHGITTFINTTPEAEPQLLIPLIDEAEPLRLGGPFAGEQAPAPPSNPGTAAMAVTAGAPATLRQSEEVPDPAAELAAELDAKEVMPLGYSSVQLRQIIPDVLPGFCVRCHLGRTEKPGNLCAWCRTLELEARAPDPELPLPDAHPYPRARRCRVCGLGREYHEHASPERVRAHRKVKQTCLLTVAAFALTILAAHVWGPLVFPALICAIIVLNRAFGRRS